MIQPSEQLVGRKDELASLDGTLASVGESGFATVALLGEPGIGKTRLLMELGARADQRRYLALTGSASELERDVPFWIFVDALDEYLRALEPGRLSSLNEDALAGLASVFPALATADAAGGRQRDERYRMHRSMRLLLETLAADRPVVILLDDLHWADSGSLEMLESLLRRPPSGAVLLGLAIRPRQLPERLVGALEQAEAEQRLTRLELAALSGEEARELLGANSGGRDADAMYAISGGNPFYLQQLARAPRATLKQATEPEDIALPRLEVPQEVAAALMDELALLPETARRVLEGAAVAGDPFQVELAAVAADVPEEVAVEALDELLRRDLIRETDVPRRFRFRHPLVRGAVYEATPAGWRLTAHERTAEALANRGASAVLQAHHVERCAREGDLDAIAVLREAAEAAGSRAPATAARLLGAALRLLPDAASADQRLELLSTRAPFQFAAGQFQEAYATLQECLRLLPDDSPEALELTAACAGLENLLGHHEEAHTRLMGALDRLSDSSSAQGVRLMLELAIDAFYRMEYESMQDWAERALEAARHVGARGPTASAAGVLALAGVCSGGIAQAQAACAEGAELVNSMSDDDLAVRIDWALDTLAVAELYLDRFDEAGAHSARAVGIAEATGQGSVLPILFWAGLIRTGRGQVSEAAGILDTAVETARLTSHAEGLVWNLFARSLTATAAGDAEVALRAAEEATEVAGSTKTFPAMGAGVALAAAHLSVDAPEQAAEVLLEMGGGETLPLIPACWRTGCYELLTRTLIECGRQDDAGRTAERAAELADALGSRTARAKAQRAAAEVALATGKAVSAASLAASAASLAEEAGAAIEAPLGWMLAGRAHAEAGERDQAVAMFQRARAAFDAVGAGGQRGNAERELGKLGRRPHRRSRKAALEGAGIDSLTERELEVARLVVDRKTNPEIAAALFLSPRTVETHVRHLFEKLGVSSRVEVARAVERADRAAR